MFFICLLCTFIQIINAGDGSQFAENIYAFTAKDIRGIPIDFGLYRHKVLLIVNVASECGYTDNHYKELNNLQNMLQEESFEILAFPCNQFGAQEPKKNSAIERFAKRNYNVEFQLFSKIKTIGEDAHPLYKWLKLSSGEEPNWNFCKYLINAEGKVIKFFSANISPMAMYSDIEGLILQNKHTKMEL
eukprot:gene7813-8659_t